MPLIKGLSIARLSGVREVGKKIELFQKKKSGYFSEIIEKEGTSGIENAVIMVSNARWVWSL